jgi:hypothetical protein
MSSKRDTSGEASKICGLFWWTWGVIHLWRKRGSVKLRIIGLASDAISGRFVSLRWGQSREKFYG